MLNANEAAVQLLDKSHLDKFNHKELIDIFFTDFNMMPMLIHENYYTSFGSNR